MAGEKSGQFVLGPQHQRTSDEDRVTYPSGKGPLSKRERLARVLFAEDGTPRFPLWRTKGRAILLAYHRIGSCTDEFSDPELFSASAADFAWQCQYVAKHFGGHSFSEAITCTPNDPARVAITFDDGYRDNHDIALPALTAQGLTATFFIATDFIDAPRLPWWDLAAAAVRHTTDDLRAVSQWLASEWNTPAGEATRSPLDAALRLYKTLPVERAERMLAEFVARCGGDGLPHDTSDPTNRWMTWDQIRNLREAGMDIGGHTCSHPVLANCPEPRQLEEIFGCRRRLADALGAAPDNFAYPVGTPAAFDATTAGIAAKAGFRTASSYFGGVNRAGKVNQFGLLRVPVETGDSRQLFAARLWLPDLFA